MYLQRLSKFFQFFSTNHLVYKSSKSLLSRTGWSRIYSFNNHLKPLTNNSSSIFYRRYISHSLVNEYNVLCLRSFHTSRPKMALPPVVWVVLRTLLRFGMVVTGRSLRKWWRNLPKSKRNYIISQAKRYQHKILTVAVLSGGVVYIYYTTHLVEDPITKRKKFMIFSEKQIIQMSMIQCELLLETYQKQIIKSGYKYNNVLDITQRILKANKHLPGTERNWQVFIIDDINTMNAFVLPSAHIFVFTGMLAVLNNQDQIAAVIAHEMAHALLHHTAEIESKTHFLEMLLMLPLVAIWTLFPDSVAIFSHFLTEYMSSILFKLPLSRSLESEADTLGLAMLSRACYDPRQASLFWKKMDSLHDQEIEWLSTHPSHQSRYETLDELMPMALKVVAKFCKKQDVNPHL